MSEYAELRTYYILIGPDRYREVTAYSLDDVVSFMKRNFQHDKIITDRKDSVLMGSRERKGFHSLPIGYADDNGFQQWRKGDPKEI